MIVVYRQETNGEEHAAVYQSTEEEKTLRFPLGSKCHTQSICPWTVLLVDQMSR